MSHWDYGIRYFGIGFFGIGYYDFGYYVLTPISWYFYHFKNTFVLGLGYFQYQGFRKNTFRIPSKIQLSSVQKSRLCLHF